MSLFRDEVYRSRTSQLDGTINLAIPVAWQGITLLLVAILFTLAVLLFKVSYARAETGQGNLSPEGGILRIVADRSGRVESVSVREGQQVRTGQTLARISLEHTNMAGGGVQGAVLHSLESQRAMLRRQQDLARSAATSERGEFDAQVGGLEGEIESASRQIAMQAELVRMARRQLEQVRQVAERGFISQRDLSTREETLLTRSQQLTVLEQARASTVAELARARASRSLASVKSLQTQQAAARDTAQNERDAAVAGGDSGYSLVAPHDGTVAAVSVFPGDTVTPSDVAMVIVPSGERLVGRFSLPTSAIGLVTPGQVVHLSIDAFPAERFGPAEGVVSQVSSVPLMRPGGKDGERPAYLVTASLRSAYLTAYGGRRSLRPGMTFTARVVTERRTLAQWLFDPIYAATGR